MGGGERQRERGGSEGLQHCVCGGGACVGAREGEGLLRSIIDYRLLLGCVLM